MRPQGALTQRHEAITLASTIWSIVSALKVNGKGLGIAGAFLVSVRHNPEQERRDTERRPTSQVDRG